MTTAAFPLAAIASIATVKQTAAAHTTFWQKLKQDEHSFLVWWEGEFVKFKKAEPTIIAALDALSKYAVPALDIALEAAGGPAGVGVEAARVITEAQNGLTVASSLVNDFGPTPTAATLYGGIASNLQGILTLDGVKNPQSQNAITKVVGLVGSAATAIAAAAQAAAPSASTQAAAQAAAQQAAGSAEKASAENSTANNAAPAVTNSSVILPVAGQASAAAN